MPTTQSVKATVAVFFGGRSVEHEVSIITGLQAFHAIDRTKYDAIPVYIGKDDLLYTGESMGDIENYKNMTQCLKDAVCVLPVRQENGRVALIRRNAKKFGNNEIAQFDVAVPAVHGTNVEDGTLAGLLESLNIPYAGCDILSSAVGMDKYVMKAVLKQAELPVLDARIVTAHDYINNTDARLDEIESAFGYPVIVKPVNLGSSVGISKASDRMELSRSIETAMDYAPRVLVERAVPNLREINCAVLGDADHAEPSVCEEPVLSDEILGYDNKYLQNAGKTGGAKSGMSSLKRRLPAELPDGMTERVQQLAVDTFMALGCNGVARIDFLNDTTTGELYVNEINTIPGSLAFYLWEARGVSFTELMDRMISLAFKRHRERQSLTFTYETNILSGITFGGAKGKS